jgi:trimeric autotransporter adhesin
MKKILTILLVSMSCNFLHAQSVGIGTTTPNGSAALDISSINKGLLIPRMTTLQRTSIGSPVAGLMVYDTDFKECYHHDGSGWKKVLNNNVWNPSSTRNWIVNLLDSIGIGTTSPDEKLNVNGGKIFVQDNRAGQNPHVIFDIPNVADNEGGLQFKRTGDTLAAINYVEDPDVANYLKFSVGSPGKGNELTVNTNGEVGIGTKTPQGQLSLGTYTGDNVAINDADGTIQFNLPGLFGGITKKVFLQLANNDDLRLGTNTGNNTGKIIFRTNSTDHVAIDQDGEVGIGTLTPIAKLHIPVGQDADLSPATNGFAMFGSSSAGQQNLLLDNNEIMVRTGTAAGILAIQNDGGEVTVGARTTINKGGEALKLNGADPSMNFYQNGVFKSFVTQTNDGLYVGVNAGNLRLDATGQVAIGNVIPAASAYKLTVTGKIICEELKVKLVSSVWPDYVFDKKYKLSTLSDVEKFITKNNHLPNIPSAAEVERNGIEVGDMQKKMMEKIEELTLYIIDLQKQVDILKNNQK